MGSSMDEYCLSCAGEGKIEMLCGICNGSGEGRYDGSKCFTCKGMGTVLVDCLDCNGTGIAEDEEDVV